MKSYVNSILPVEDLTPLVNSFFLPLLIGEPIATIPSCCMESLIATVLFPICGKKGKSMPNAVESVQEFLANLKAYESKLVVNVSLAFGYELIETRSV